MKKRVLSMLLAAVMVLALLPGMALAVDTAETPALDQAWTEDQDYTLASPAPWDLDELKQVVDVQDPRSVAAYWIWAVNRLVDNFDDGMDMMKYLFADIEPYDRGFIEGGKSGNAGWDTYFNERIQSDDFKWLPRAYFDNVEGSAGFVFDQPLTVALYYNDTNTEAINEQTLNALGRLNIVYWVQSKAAGNQVNITLSKFEGSDRWYVTSGTSSTALFYDQRSGVSISVRTAAKNAVADTSTQAEHTARYSGDWNNQTTTSGNGSGGEAWVPPTITSIGVDPETSGTAYASTQEVEVNGTKVTFQMYALKDPETGNPTNYVKLRDVAFAINGSNVQYSVGWSAELGVTANRGEKYESNGSEMKTPFSGDRDYICYEKTTCVNGVAVSMKAFMLSDDDGGGYTYYKLRDLGQALGFQVGYEAGRGIYIDTTQPYTG